MSKAAIGLWIVLVSFGSAAAQAQAPKPAAVPNAAPAAWVIGDGYVVKVRRTLAEERVVGDLAKANDYWIVLRCRAVGAETAPLAALKNNLGPSKAPKSNGRTVTDEFVWIPREAATIERHSPRGSRLPAIHLPDDFPPRQAACTVEVASGYQVARQAGQIIGSAGAKLALVQQAGRSGQQIAHDQILSIRYSQPQPEASTPPALYADDAAGR